MSVAPRALRADARYGLALVAAVPVVALIAALGPARFAPHWPDARTAVLMIGAAPVLEEIVFRAGLQGWLAARWHARWLLSPANLLTALVFALAHGLNHPPAWAAATAAPALVFGYFYERHRRLLAPIGLHAGYNAAYLVLLVSH